METSQIALVQSTFKQVLPIKDVAADLFYNRLFEIEPSTRALFKGDIKEQGNKLMAALGVVVAGLTAIETIVPTVQDMAVKIKQWLKSYELQGVKTSVNIGRGGDL